jgi:hypothetical protein
MQWNRNCLSYWYLFFYPERLVGYVVNDQDTVRSGRFEKDLYCICKKYYENRIILYYTIHTLHHTLQYLVPLLVPRRLVLYGKSVFFTTILSRHMGSTISAFFTLHVRGNIRVHNNHQYIYIHATPI